MVLLVLETHGALHLGRGVDELAQRVQRQRVIVAAGGDELELASQVVCALGVLAREEEALDLAGRVEGVAVLLELLVGEALEHPTQIARVGSSVFVDDVAEDQHLAVAEDIGRHPVEGAPVDAQAQIALLLGGEAADRGAVEGEVFVGPENKLLVVVEQVQAAFKVTEEHGHGLDPLLVGQVLQPFLANLVQCNAVSAVGFGFQVLGFQLLIGESEKIAIVSGHGTPFQAQI